MEPPPMQQVLVSMGSREYVLPLLIAFFIAPIYFEWGSANLLLDEAEAEKKFTPSNDADIFFEKVKVLGEGFGTKWMVMPDGNGTARLTILDPELNLLASEKTLTSHNFKDAAKMVTFIHFKKDREESSKFQLKDVENFQFVNTKPTKVIIHGWMADSESSVITNIKEAYLSEEDVNVIGVDWSPISDDWYYPNAARGTKVVGKVVGHFIDSLVKNHNARYSDFHVIGHSLGAHVAGHAGNSAHGKIGRITGLDPALPGFEDLAGPEGRLDRSDAEFVDVIHTCAGVLGMSVPVGHVDFYPNGGTVFQPGCSIEAMLLNFQACSHSRAHQLFAESISRNSDFESIKCQDWEHFKKSECDAVYTIMGENIPRDTQHGVYYLRTNWEFPFSQGHAGIIY